MGTKPTDSILQNSFRFQVGPLDNLSDLTVTIAQASASELDGTGIVVNSTYCHSEDAVTPDDSLAARLEDELDFYVCKDGTDLRGLIVNKGATEISDIYFFSRMASMSLIIAGGAGAQTAILNYTDTFDPVETNRGHFAKLRGFQNAFLEKKPERVFEYLTTFLGGVRHYINEINLGNVAVPLSSVVVALDKMVFSVWQQHMVQLQGDYLQFKSLDKRRIIEQRRALKDIRVNLRECGQWVTAIARGDGTILEAVHKAIIAYLASDKDVRRAVESWHNFTQHDGNVAKILNEACDTMPWKDFLDLLPDVILKASTLVHYFEIMLDRYDDSIAWVVQRRILEHAQSK